MASAAMVNAAEAGLFDLLASSLPSILTRLQARRSDMDRYQYLMERVGRCDVRTDAHFQRTFNGLYMVRRGAPWRKAFYDLFETQKTAGEQSFQHVLTVLHDLTGRVEASFASKLLATIDPAMPVYDSWVRINMALKTRTGPALQRIPALCEDYARIAGAYAWMMGQRGYERIRADFDEALPNLRDLSDVKKIDLLLWQSRTS